MCSCEKGFELKKDGYECEGNRLNSTQVKLVAMMCKNECFYRRITF